MERLRAESLLRAGDRDRMTGDSEMSSKLEIFPSRGRRGNGLNRSKKS
jgi:hypothetical protein